MEDVLAVYRRPYDPQYPVICMDESPKPLIGEVRQPIPAAPGCVRKVDDEYVRNGVAELFLAIEPLIGKFHVTVESHRTKADWAAFIKDLVDNRYPHAKKVVLVMDNLNTHKIGSFYEAFPPSEARRLVEKIEIHYTPKHGSWLNIAELGFSILKGCCIPDRIDNIDDLRNQIDAFVLSRNQQQKAVNWQFTTDDARIKLRRLYPDI